MGKTILNATQKKVIVTLSHKKVFTDNFYLTGGTALSEYYLHHRLSEDLDFFTEKETDQLWLTTISQEMKKAIGADKIDIQQSFNRLPETFGSTFHRPILDSPTYRIFMGGYKSKNSSKI